MATNGNRDPTETESSTSMALETATIPASASEKAPGHPMDVCLNPGLMAMQRSNNTKGQDRNCLDQWTLRPLRYSISHSCWNETVSSMVSWNRKGIDPSSDSLISMIDM